MNSVLNEFKQRIIAVKQKKHGNLARLAKLSSVDILTIRNIYCGENINPKIRTLEKLNQALEVIENE